MSTRTNGYDVAAILADIAAGMRQLDIAAKHGVSKSLVSRLGIGNGMQRRAVRPEHPCPTCGVTTRAQGSCRACQREHHFYPEPTAADALPEGNWRFDPWKRIRVYVRSEAS